MYNVRYHIASLMAVFLALGVGLLLGSLIIDKDLLAGEQEKLMASIRSDVETVRRRNQGLEEEVANLRAFESQVLAAAVKGRLNDQRVAVISLGREADDTHDSIADVLAKAGATTVDIKLAVGQLDPSDAGLRTALASAFAHDPEAPDFESALWNRLALELAGSEPLALLPEMGRAQLAEYGEGLESVDSVVVIAASQAADRDTLFLTSIRDAPNLHVVAVEEYDLDPSRVPAFQLLDISTVDNVDEVSGQLSLVYLLQSRDTRAGYGRKPTAGALMPS